LGAQGREESGSRQYALALKEKMPRSGEIIGEKP